MQRRTPCRESNRPGLSRAVAAICATLLGVGCEQERGETFGPFVPVGEVPTDLKPKGSLEEISGVVVSRRYPNLLWVHDDSGGGANLVALRFDGTFVQNYRVRGADAKDWEDIALGPGPDAEHDYIYLADVGNNEGKREKFVIVRVLEPEPPSEPGDRIRIRNAGEFRFRYPDDAPDSEVLLIDPNDGTPYLIAKDRQKPARVFRYPLPLDESERKTVKLVAVIQDLGGQLTGGDVAADGSAVFLRSKRGVHRFQRSEREPLWRTLLGESTFILTGDQGQGEALAVEPGGDGLITISEGEAAVIWRSRIVRR